MDHVQRFIDSLPIHNLDNFGKPTKFGDSTGCEYFRSNISIKNSTKSNLLGIDAVDFTDFDFSEETYLDTSGASGKTISNHSERKINPDSTKGIREKHQSAVSLSASELRKSSHLPMSFNQFLIR